MLPKIVIAYAQNVRSSFTGQGLARDYAAFEDSAGVPAVNQVLENGPVI